MTLVDYCEEVLGEIIKEAERTFALASAVEVARIVLDAGAVAEFFDHLYVVCHAFLDALSLEFVAFSAEVFDLSTEVELYLSDSRRLPCR